MAEKVKFDFDPFKGFDLSDLSKPEKDELKKDIKDLVIESILDKVGDAKTPVSKNKPTFTALSKAYKAAKGDVAAPKPNLELEGDLLDALIVKDLKGDRLRLTVKSDEQEKADGHNQHSGKAKAWAASKAGKKLKSGKTGKKFPRRPFIPDENRGEDFRKDIKQEIKSVINDFLEDKKDSGKNRR